MPELQEKKAFFYRMENLGIDPSTSRLPSGRLAKKLAKKKNELNNSVSSKIRINLTLIGFKERRLKPIKKKGKSTELSHLTNENQFHCYSLP